MSQDAAACVGCGLCVPACPVGAIDGVGQVPQAVASRVAGGAELRCDVARIVAPEEGEFADVPCIAAVDPEALAAGVIVADSAPTIVRADCEVCPVGAASRVRETLARASEALTASGSPALTERVVTPESAGAPARAARPTRPAPAVSRRSLFGLRKAPAPEPVPSANPLDALPAKASARDVWLAVGENAALPGIVVEDGCTSCGGCARVCPTQALTLSGDQLTLAPDRCVDCGECVRVCPEDVVRRVPRQPGRQARVLVETETARCDRCARPLGPGEQGTCHGCATKASLADGIWGILGDSR